MATKTSARSACLTLTKLRFLKLGFAAVLTLLITLGLLGGVFAGATTNPLVDANAVSLKGEAPSEQQPTSTATPEFLRLSDSAAPTPDASSSSASSASSGSQVYINFNSF